MNAKLDQKLLDKKDQYPTEEIIFSHIGRTIILWRAFFKYIHDTYPELSKEWRYYKDGHSWLLKVVKKSKTIFWLSVIKGAFRITFYFPDKAEEKIRESPIADDLKNQFINGKYYNKIRGLTVIVRNKNDLAYVKSLIKIKINII